jgi:hypothetical protein
MEASEDLFDTAQCSGAGYDRLAGHLNITILIPGRQYKNAHSSGKSHALSQIAAEG